MLRSGPSCWPTALARWGAALVKAVENTAPEAVRTPSSRRPPTSASHSSSGVPSWSRSAVRAAEAPAGTVSPVRAHPGRGPALEGTADVAPPGSGAPVAVATGGAGAAGAAGAALRSAQPARSVAAAAMPSPVARHRRHDVPTVVIGAFLPRRSPPAGATSPWPVGEPQLHRVEHGEDLPDPSVA